MCTFLSHNGAWWDMGLVHCGICATGLLLVTYSVLKRYLNQYWWIISHLMILIEIPLHLISFNWRKHSWGYCLGVEAMCLAVSLDYNCVLATWDVAHNNVLCLVEGQNYLMWGRYWMEDIIVLRRGIPESILFFIYSQIGFYCCQAPLYSLLS